MPKDQRKPGFMSAEAGGKSRGRLNPRSKQDDLPGVEQEGNPELAGRGGLFGGRLLHRFVRNRAAAILVHDHGFECEEACDLVATVSDEDINAQTTAAGLGNVGALGDGGFLQWLKDHQDQILQVIMAIVQILAMFGAKSVAKAAVKKPAKKTDKDDEAEDK